MNVAARPTIVAFALLAGLSSAAVSVLPEKIPCVVPDRQDFQNPDRVHLAGWLGLRIDGNAKARLAKIDPARLLEGYRKRPGRQAWDGEHVGKWLHAATLAWVNTGDATLREHLDFVAADLCKCQLADGYLGTYVDAKRWTSWDVWAHKYNLIGLLTYIRYTGNTQPLDTCRHMADLLIDTFGDTPGKRDIIKAGEHVGMAPTSVLEPMVLLYRFTGDARYLEFCKYLLRSWDQPNGPHIISTLLSAKRVDKVANAKAYEMLSCLNGALEYYRVTGDAQILEACLNAWRDIVDNRLYITGTASYREHFHADFDLPNTNNVGETCVTVTWLQFNAHLLRLTGEARFAEQLERVVLNQLLGAQKPDCTAWGYYVQMEGKKPYSASLDGHCCLSSGPRGIALIPTFAISTDDDGAVINLYDAGEAELRLRDQSTVKLKIDTQFPADGKVRITVAERSAEKAFAIKLRIPAWSSHASLRVNDQNAETPNFAQYHALRREWKTGDRIEIDLKPEARVIAGDHLNAGKAAFLFGPLVLAADDALFDNAEMNIARFRIPGTDLAALNVTPEPAPDSVKTWPGAHVFSVTAQTLRATETLKAGSPITLRLIPFADAGGTGSPYRVWLPLAGTVSANLLAEGTESRSRPGNLNGSIIDDDPQSAVVTWDGARPGGNVDTFAVTLKSPVTIQRVVFAHGKCFHDGGWFDASAGKPQVEVLINQNWQAVGKLDAYPATTATDNKGLKEGQLFTLKLRQPMSVQGVRVVGTPACGDNPKQAFSSCAELQAFTE